MHAQKEEMNKPEQLKGKKKQMRQTQLIDAAEKIFINLGYDATTLEMITDDLGYNKRTFYLYFRDKDDIFFAVLLRTLEALDTRMHEAAATRITGLDKLQSLGMAYFTYFIENPVFFEFNRTFEARNYYYRRNPNSESGEFASNCLRVNDKITDLLISCIKLGMKDKSIKVKIDAKKLMLILWGMSLGTLEVILMRQKQLDATYQTSADEIFRTYLTFIKKFLDGEN